MCRNIKKLRRSEGQPTDVVGNIFANIPERLDGEITEALGGGKNTRIERIVSRGHTSPDDFWYDQKENEWVLLLSGGARLSFQGQKTTTTLAPGDYVDIPAHTKHRVEWTDPDEDTIWLVVFY